MPPAHNFQTEHISWAFPALKGRDCCGHGRGLHPNALWPSERAEGCTFLPSLSQLCARGLDVPPAVARQCAVVRGKHVRLQAGAQDLLQGVARRSHGRGSSKASPEASSKVPEASPWAAGGRGGPAGRP